MDNLWKHDEKVICVHLRWELLAGWLVIRESWVMIFQNTEVIKFNITNPNQDRRPPGAKEGMS
jgi:hypothetical protein